MTSISLHPTPARPVVIREQIRSVFLALRTETLLVAGALLLFLIFAIIAAVRAPSSPHERMGFFYGPGAAVPMGLLGVLIPFGVWRAEDPSRRAYHWAMPVMRTSHTWLKLVCGWLWMMCAVAAYIVWIVLVSALIHAIRGYTGGMEWAPAWEWLVPFTAATVTYLISSIAVIASDHPWRWMLGVAIGYYVLAGFFNAMRMPDAMRTVLSVAHGYYGLITAAFGAVYTMHDPVFERWIGATLLWGGVALVGAVWASYHRPE